MRTNRILANCFLLFAFCLCSLSAEAIRVGKIDLSVAVSLHPRMSLFDFDRMGFFKVEPGLTEEEFKTAVAKLKDSKEAASAIEEREKIEKKLAELDHKKSYLVAAMSDPSADGYTTAHADLAVVATEENALHVRLKDLSYMASCPDLTDPATTRQILDEIETEVLEAVREVAAQKKFDLVLNNSVPVPYGYPVRYRSGEMFGQGIPGIDYTMFYAFLARTNLAHPLDETPPSRDLINWLELTRFPEAMNLLPLRPYPVVLSGGECILSEVLEKIYVAHKIAPEVFKVVDSVINKLDQMNKFRVLSDK